MIANYRFVCVLVLSISAMLFIGCGRGIPKGDSKEVQKLVCQITVKELRKELTPKMLGSVTGIPGFVQQSSGIDNSYEGVKALIDKPKNQRTGITPEDAKKAIAQVDEAIAKLNIQLSNIRDLPVPDGAKMSKSAATLTLGEKQFPIEYTAQRNSDGDLYVEVSGL